MLCENLNFSYLIAAEHVASDDPSRPGIVGVRVEALTHQNRLQGALIVSTNGHALSCRFDAHAQILQDFTLTIEALRQIKSVQRALAKVMKGKTAGLSSRLRLNIYRDGFELFDSGICPGDIEGLKQFHPFLGVAFESFDFPCWRNCIPPLTGKRSEKPLQFNPAYLYALHEAAGISPAAMRGRTSFLDLYDSDCNQAAVLVDPSNPSWFGLLMPMNNVDSPAIPLIPFLKFPCAAAA